MQQVKLEGYLCRVQISLKKDSKLYEQEQRKLDSKMQIELKCAYAGKCNITASSAYQLLYTLFFFLREIKSNHLLSLAIKQNRKTGIQKNNIKKELLFFNDVGSTYIFHSYLSSSVQFDILDCLGRRET